MLRSHRLGANLFRPADLRAAVNALANLTIEDSKSKSKDKPPLAKRSKSTPKSPNKRKTSSDDEGDEAYHFIGYVPAHGKVWELDGLKSGPLEVGELPTNPAATASSSDATHLDSSRTHEGWMDVVRPALRMKMRKYGGDGPDAENIRFSLLAIVDDQYERVSDELKLLKRQRGALKRRLGGESVGKVCLNSFVVPRRCYPTHATQLNTALIDGSGDTFSTTLLDSKENGPVYGRSFGFRKMHSDITILGMPQEQLPNLWSDCVRSAASARLAVEDEIVKEMRAEVSLLRWFWIRVIANCPKFQTEHVKRTHDYEPFIREIVSRLHDEGLLNPILGLDNEGKVMKLSNSSPAGRGRGRGRGKVNTKM
jgi:ubiquitin carboxyl-terminal hydrolase L5